MESRPLTFKGFFNRYSKRIQGKECIKKSYSCFKDYPLMPSQAMYVLDIMDMCVPYHKGVEGLLGYSKEEFDIDVLNTYYHPDDHDRYVHLVKISNEWARKIKPEPFSVEVSIDYRVKKKDDTFLKVLRQSTVFENCLDKSIKSVFTILTDISRIKTDTSVNLSVIDSNTGRVLLEDKENDTSLVRFSRRETEILQKIKKGLNSKLIAEELNISKHTVDTFRRKMLQKSGCKNTVELLSFCAQQGIL